jgi:LacI family transcriptional regulator
MATLKDVAAKAQVSLATVSYVMNNKGNISEATRLKVLKAAEELNYKPSNIVKEDKRDQVKVIGTVTSHIIGPFHGEFLAGIEENAKQNGYHFMAFTTSGNAYYERYIQYIFKERKPSGAVVLNYNITDQTLIKYSSKDFPIVVADSRELDSEYIWNVMVDNVMGGYQATKYLLDCGHREIAFMGGSIAIYEVHMRYKGYCDALRERGLNPEKQLYCQGNHTKSGGYNTARMLIAQNQVPQAMFCANDEMAIGVIEACMEAGIRIPEDISIIGFDDIELASYVKPALTTVRQPVEELARAAVQTLIMAMHGNNPVKLMKLPTELVIRESVKRL